VGIVHRDIKPGNVLLAEDGMVKITDFGVSHVGGDGTVTVTEILAGTPAYLAPEVAQGHRATFSSDVFSLGATLYTALEGMPPFGLDTNPVSLLHQVASGEVIAPRRSGPLTPVLVGLLARNPDQRPTMHQAHEALANLARRRQDPSAPAPSSPRHDRLFEPLSGVQQTLIQASTLEEAITPVGSTGMDAAAGRGPAEGDHRGWPGRRKLLTGVMTVVLLAIGVLVAVLISQANPIGANGANPATPTSGHPSQSPQALLTRPDRTPRRC
jgi:serine/threonine protein kinase